MSKCYQNAERTKNWRTRRCRHYLSPTDVDAYCDELPNRPTALIESSGGSRRGSGDPGDFPPPPYFGLKKKKKKKNRRRKKSLSSMSGSATRIYLIHRINEQIYIYASVLQWIIIDNHACIIRLIRLIKNRSIYRSLSIYIYIYVYIMCTATRNPFVKGRRD